MQKLLMELDVVPTPNLRIRSGYKSGKPGFPSRLGFLHPSALAAFIEMQDECGWNIVFTDLWRAAQSSFIKKFPPGKPMRKWSLWPGTSGHNYGYSGDIEVGFTLKRMASFLKKKFDFANKRALDLFMQGYGFYCHRRDHKRDREEWHYNWLCPKYRDNLWQRPDHPDAGPSWYDTGGRPRKYSKGALDAQIEGNYGKFWFSMADHRKPNVKKAIQTNLADLHFYRGEIDGKFGPLMLSAVERFQRAWRLKPDGKAGRKTNRILSFRGAEIRHRELSKIRNVSLKR